MWLGHVRCEAWTTYSRVAKIAELRVQVAEAYATLRTDVLMKGHRTNGLFSVQVRSRTT